jgi:hypothetical protein
MGTTITASVPTSSAKRDRRTASSVLSEPVPAITGTRPLMCLVPALISSSRSFSVNDPFEPVLPRIAMPCTPFSI